MSDDFERYLRARFAASDDLPISERFGGEVRERIAGLRRARRIMLAATAAAASLTVAILGAPLLAAGTALVAEASVTLNGSVSVLLASPVGYALGALTVVAALADAFSE